MLDALGKTRSAKARMPSTSNSSSGIAMTAQTRKLLVLVLWWMVGVALWACYYVVSVLSGPPGPDWYANSVSFQLLAFAVVRLPLAVLILILAVVWTVGRSNRVSD
jgi:hypothetical protein